MDLKGKREKGKGTRLALAVVCSFFVIVGAAQAWQPPAPPEGFVPAGDMLARERLPAAPFVIGAYSVAWLVVFGYLWSIGRRIGGVERDLAEVSRRIAAGARR